MDPDILLHARLFSDEEAGEIFREAFALAFKDASCNCELYPDSELPSAEMAVSGSKMIAAIRQVCLSKVTAAAAEAYGDRLPELN